jgi:hypothetical protein
MTGLVIYDRFVIKNDCFFMKSESKCLFLVFNGTAKVESKVIMTNKHSTYCKSVLRERPKGLLTPGCACIPIAFVV